MKKMLVILLTLCLVLALPLLAMAEEVTTTPETIEETAPTTEAPTEAPTEAATEAVTESDSAESEVGGADSSEVETAYKMELGFYPETLLTTLPIMGMGMLGIFAVTCVIVLAVVVLSKLGKEKEQE